MKYALKITWHGSVFLARVAWIGATIALEFFMLLINSSSSERRDNLAAPEVPDALDQGHPNWEYYWGEHE